MDSDPKNQSSENWETRNSRLAKPPFQRALQATWMRAPSLMRVVGAVIASNKNSKSCMGTMRCKAFYGREILSKTFFMDAVKSCQITRATWLTQARETDCPYHGTIIIVPDLTAGREETSLLTKHTSQKERAHFIKETKNIHYSCATSNRKKQKASTDPAKIVVSFCPP